MKNLSCFFILLASFIFVGCANQTIKILDATWVSMKHPMPPTRAQKLKKEKNISEEYCQQYWSETEGLMEGVIKKAEKENNIDYVKNPSFTKTVGRSCMQLIGEGYRITAGESNDRRK